MSFFRLNKVAAPSNPAANKLTLYYDSGAPGVGVTTKPVMLDESGNKLVLGGFATKDYRLVRVTHVLQGTVTFTPTNGAQALYVEAIGAGGAGGGGATASANCSIGSGGSSGGYSTKWVTGTLKSSYTVAVGAGGTGNAGTTGGNGSVDTTFDSPSICTAKAGTGGTTLAAGTTNVTQAGPAGGAAGSGVGDDTMDGSDGGWGVRIAAAVAQSGDGGASPLSGAAARGVNAAGAGVAGKFPGGGGGGGMSTSTSTAGGAGANGLIRVWEFA